MTKGGADSQNITDLTPCQKFLCQHMRSCQALIVTNHQKLSSFLCCMNHFLALLQGNCHRLFTQDMLSGLQCRNGDLCMGMVGYTYGNRIDLRII